MKARIVVDNGRCGKTIEVEGTKCEVMKELCSQLDDGSVITIKKAQHVPSNTCCGEK